MNERFAVWLDRELTQKGWSQSEAARRGEISSTMINMVINGQANPGLELCRGIARAFNLPLEEVLRKAGILPPLTSRDAGVSAVLARLDEMSGADRKETLTLFQTILDYRRRNQVEGASTSAAPRKRRSRAARPEEPVEPTSVSVDREARVEQFRAVFSALPEAEQDALLRELRALRDRLVEPQPGPATDPTNDLAN
jgi:transcriptional regulator with XRE-family HTH domain